MFISMVSAASKTEENIISNCGPFYSDDIRTTSPREICIDATIVGSGRIRKWSNLKGFVNEAQRRGLTCGVGLENSEALRVIGIETSCGTENNGEIKSTNEFEPIFCEANNSLWKTNKPSFFLDESSIDITSIMGCPTFRLDSKSENAVSVFCDSEIIDEGWVIPDYRTERTFEIGFPVNGSLNSSKISIGETLEFLQVEDSEGKTIGVGLQCSSESMNSAFNIIASSLDIEPSIKAPQKDQRAVSKLNPQNNPQCSKLLAKLEQHIEKEEYEKAELVTNLISKLECETVISKSSAPNNNPQILSCDVGPLGQTLFGDYGTYQASAIENNPPKGCINTYKYCKSRAESIADGANIAPSERTNKQNNFTAYCNSRVPGGAGRVNCDIYSNQSSGGFAEGFADGLSKGLQRGAQKRRIYVSSFELCMVEMGYELREK